MEGVVNIPLSGYSLVRPSGPNAARRHALQHFLVGPENCLVEPAVRSVLDNAQPDYNPLLIHGPNGSGKSHLARGLAARWETLRRRGRVIYTSAKGFAGEVADAIETQGSDELRDYYRQAALFVIEDIERLAGKGAAQEELIHTFDFLLTHGRQIVATASTAPAQLKGIRPALQSRLSTGLTLPLAPPGRRTRAVILRRLARLRKLDLGEAAARLLAETVSGNVPDLLLALDQLEQCGRVDDRSIGLDAVRAYLSRRKASQPALREIAAAAARFFSLKLSDLRSPSRRRPVLTARGVAMYLARRWTDNSLDEIGNYFGGRDHTTVMHSCRKMESLLKTDPAIREAVKQLDKKWEVK
ncbi:MAG: AAA family ATPase [Candidatus Nealsonbacteria bacterium]|nr:AAA family ATPase [Candidatus Nealsonbacteria bacterium]